MKSSPRSPQLEKYRAQQQRSNATKIKKINKIKPLKKKKKKEEEHDSRILGQHYHSPAMDKSINPSKHLFPICKMGMISALPSSNVVRIQLKTICKRVC